jgi:hypothetical protein
VKRVLGLQLVCLALGCSDSFTPAWAVTNLRAVGALIEVDGQPARANPNPGDGVQVTIHVTDKGASAPDMTGVPALTPPPLQWSFVACIPLPTLRGTPICATQIEPCDGCRGTPPDDPLAVPVMRFQVPSESELEAAQATRTARPPRTRFFGSFSARPAT